MLLDLCYQYCVCKEFCLVSRGVTVYPELREWRGGWCEPTTVPVAYIILVTSINKKSTPPIVSVTPSFVKS